MTAIIKLVGHERDDRQRVIHAVRAHRIDQLAPDRREAMLAAERYLRRPFQRDGRVTAIEARLHWIREAHQESRHLIFRQILQGKP